jgi:hypothetical protein
MTSRRPSSSLGSFRKPEPEPAGSFAESVPRLDAADSATLADTDRRSQVQFRLNRAQIRAIKQVALDDDISIQELLLKLVRDEFERRGLTPFPD